MSKEEQKDANWKKTAEGDKLLLGFHLFADFVNQRFSALLQRDLSFALGK